MGMQSDILASTPLSASGQVQDQNANNLGRTRIRGVYIVPSGTAGTVTLYNGTSTSDQKRMTLNTVASATQPTYLWFPAEGMVFTTSVYAALSNVGYVTFFYS
jgi:hypothetical protein